MSVFRAHSILMLLALVLFAGCGSDPVPEFPAYAMEGEEAFGVIGEDGRTTFTLTPRGETVYFAQTRFRVKAGEDVRVILQNTATDPHMAHNVVFVTNEEALNRIGLAALLVPQRAYIPEDADILFHTPLAQPGETVEVTFTAPSRPGLYPYVCTVPGHHVLMRGVMRVE